MSHNLLDHVILDEHAKPSINYAKARSAIEETAKNRSEKRAAKLVVIEFLHGTLNKGKTLFDGTHAPNYVVFPDNSKAKF